MSDSKDLQRAMRNIRRGNAKSMVMQPEFRSRVVTKKTAYNRKQKHKGGWQE